MDYLKELKEVNDLIKKIEQESIKEAKKMVKNKKIDVGELMGHKEDSKTLRDFYNKINISMEK